MVSVSSSHFKIVFCLFVILPTRIHTSLISSSEVQLCRRTSKSFEPFFETGDACRKKFLVTLAVRNGQGESSSIYAEIRTVENKTLGHITREEQLNKPFRISVTKSDVHIHYPVKYLTSINNNPFEKSYNVKNSWLGIARCRESKHCRNGMKGYCCKSSRDEKLSRAWEYKRGVGRKVGHYYSHKYSRAICMGRDNLWYNVFIIEDPYVTYKINVTVQQLDYQLIATGNKDKRDIWKTIGYAEIGPQRIGQNTANNQKGTTSGPKIKATWHGDFSTNTYYANFNSKYLLTPDWRASSNPSEARKAQQVKGGSNEWLLVDRHLVDDSGAVCNKLGSDEVAFKGQENRCYQKEGSCFKVTVRKLWEKAKELKRKKQPNHYFASFYGDFLGPHVETNNKVVRMNEASPDNTSDFQLIYKSSAIHKSLVTLTFTAETVSFVDNRSKGRIVEAMIENFSALSGAGSLLVIIQNTGRVTADYLISVTRCTEGIIKVSQQSKTVDPRQQVPVTFQVSSSLNEDYNHTCFVELRDKDSMLLDVKKIAFKTEGGCIYCPAGQCNCACKSQNPLLVEDEEEQSCKKEIEDEYLNPYWEPQVIIIKPCYHCWITNSITNPVTLLFMIVIILLCIGMLKMLIGQMCCRTKDGRPIDVVGVILGTANREHTKRKQRSVTIQFLLGACFFVYLPFLPLMIIFCHWRRTRWAKKRLRRKALRKKQRAFQRKRAALEVTQGLLSFGNEDDITINDALMAFEQETDKPSVLVVSSSSDTDEQDFYYSSSSESESTEKVSSEDEMLLKSKRKDKKKRTKN